MKIMTITPSVASEWLTKNTANRRIIEHQVQSLINEIANGWQLNGETIKFDKYGNLIDGQHRLTACVKSGIPFQSYVVFGLDNHVFDTIDVGSKRKGADCLSIIGAQNNRSLSAIVKAYCEYQKTGTFSGSKISASSREIVNEYQSNKEIYDALTLDHLSVSNIVVSSFFSVCKAAIEIYGYEWYKPAIHKLKTGENLVYGDPIFTLREWSIINKAKSQRQTRNAVYVKAVKASATGKELKLLKYSIDEKFPSI